MMMLFNYFNLLYGTNLKCSKNTLTCTVLLMWFDFRSPVGVTSVSVGSLCLFFLLKLQKMGRHIKIFIFVTTLHCTSRGKEASLHT